MSETLPVADRIERIRMLTEEDPEKSKIFLQYTDHNNKGYEIEMPLLESLHLLNLLEAMSIQRDFTDLREQLMTVRLINLDF